MSTDAISDLQALLNLYLLMEKLEKTTNTRTPRLMLKSGNREKYSIYFNLVKELEVTDVDTFRNFLRMTPKTFKFLLRQIAPKIEQVYAIKKPISPEEQLAMTLRYLATGDSMVSISYSFRVGKTTVGSIIRRVCRAICETLRPTELCVPDEEKWRDIAEKYETRWNFPNCLGAIDGKHIMIQAPKKSGSAFFNYKGFHSVVLMAVCDAEYKFTLVDIGKEGRQSDGGVFRSSSISRNFTNKVYDIPSPRMISPNGTPINYFLVGDAAFPLSLNLLRPYAANNMDMAKIIFNYRLSRARNTIENAFGILAAKWRIFRRAIIADTQLVNLIVRTCVSLHNFLLSKEKTYCPRDYVDFVNERGEVSAGNWRNEVGTNGAFRSVGRMGANHYGGSAAEQRDLLKHYFMTSGSVPWQWNRTQYVT